MLSYYYKGGHLAYTYDGQTTYFWPKSTETNSIERNQGKMSKNSEFKEYNGKIASADKAEREEDLKLD